MLTRENAAPAQGDRGPNDPEQRVLPFVQRDLGLLHHEERGERPEDRQRIAEQDQPIVPLLDERLAATFARSQSAAGRNDDSIDAPRH